MDILIEELKGGLWVVALEKNTLQGLEFDPPAEEVRWGSIYWAKVARIDKAQDAVFVNLDGDNIGILYNADVRITQKDGSYKNSGGKDIGKILQPGQMIPVQAKSGYLPKMPDQPYAKSDGKMPRVSMNIMLPGRFLIYAPMEKENRISQRIKDKKLRAQMQIMMDSLGGQSQGCILRASGADTQTDMLLRESKILSRAWQSIQQYLEGDMPQLIMAGPDAIQRTLSDQATKNIENIEVTTMDHYQLAEEWCDIYAPDLVTKVHPVEIPGGANDFGLFEHYDIIGQIEGLLAPYALLDRGATVIIQEAAAITAIDVNTAADTRGHLAVNLDAAQEIARQIRLRNMGGAFIIDFLRLKNAKEKDKLFKALEGYFNDDPCTVQIHGWSNLGMIEVTRQRRTPALAERFASTMEE